MQTEARKTAAIHSITAESLMRWNFGAMETAEHIRFVRGSCAHFKEAFKGATDQEALETVQGFLQSPKAARYLARKAVWEAYWAAGAAHRARIAEQSSQSS